MRTFITCKLRSEKFLKIMLFLVTTQIMFRHANRDTRLMSRGNSINYNFTDQQSRCRSTLRKSCKTEYVNLQTLVKYSQFMEQKPNNFIVSNFCNTNKNIFIVFRYSLGSSNHLVWKTSIDMRPFCKSTYSRGKTRPKKLQMRYYSRLY